MLNSTLAELLAYRVICMSCEEITEREALQEELAALNPDVARAVALMPRAGQSAATRKSVADSADSATGALLVNILLDAASVLFPVPSPWQLSKLN